MSEYVSVCERIYVCVYVRVRATHHHATLVVIATVQNLDGGVGGHQFLHWLRLALGRVQVEEDRQVGLRGRRVDGKPV